MPLECCECEMDLRGGHDPECSRHPVNNKKHVLFKPVALLREYFGPRDEHHPNCSSRNGKKCDCYAVCREKQHAALDQIIGYAFRED